MRFAAANRQSSGNWINAGKTGAKKANDAFSIATAYSPDYGGIASAWQKAESSKEITAMKAQADVVQKGINTSSQVKQAEHGRDAKKFVGDVNRRIKFAGKLAAIGGMVAEGLRKDDSDRPLPPITTDTEAIRAAREQANIDNGLNPDGTPIRTDEPATPATPETPAQPAAQAEPSSNGADNSTETATQPVAQGGTLTFKDVQAMAQRSGARYPGLVAAQWSLESANGTSSLATDHNNLFGQKGAGVNMSTNEEGSGGMYRTNADFMTFESPQASVDYLVNRWYKDYKDFKGVNNAGSFTEAAQMLKSQGYATDSAYVDKLIRIARENGVTL